MCSYAWEEPLCLIENEADGIKANLDTCNKIKEIKDPVVVVGVAGLYRTGKSYLMNRLAQRQRGFALGATVQSKTKGIWSWCTPHPRKKNTCLLLLDTEGLGDAEKGSQENDTHIFVLCVLLCSTLVYNSRGTIDQDAIDKIYFIAEMSEHVKVKAKPSKDDDDDDGTKDFHKFFPNFVWAVRDFTLKLELDGKTTDSDGYLEKTLALKKGKSKKVSDHNTPRLCIRTYFPKRKCFTFPFPVLNQEDFQNLDTIPVKKLDKKFLEVSQRFVDYIYDESPCKDVGSRTLTGSSFAILCQLYTEAIGKGAVPCIESAIELTAQRENENAVKEGIEHYVNNMLTITLPTDTVESLSERHLSSEKAAIALFLKRRLHDAEGKYQKQLQEKIKEEHHNFCDNNAKASKDKCSKIIESLYQEIQSKVDEGHFSKVGGYSEYKSLMDKVIRKFRETPAKGIKGEEALKEFMKSKAAEGKLIMADSKLKDHEKKVEEAAKKAEIAEQQRKAAEEREKQTKQNSEDYKKSTDENIEQLKKKLEEEQDNIIKKMKKDQENLKEEGNKLYEQGFKEEADALIEGSSKQETNPGFLQSLSNGVTHGIRTMAFTTNPLLALGAGVVEGFRSWFS